MLNTTCKTCKFWTKDSKECNKLDTHTDYKDNQLMVDVKVADDHNLEVTIKTGPNFGCVLYETVLEE